MGVKQVRENSMNFKKRLQNTIFMHKYIVHVYDYASQAANNSMQRYMHKFFKRPVLAG